MSNLNDMMPPAQQRATGSGPPQRPPATAKTPSIVDMRASPQGEPGQSQPNGRLQQVGGVLDALTGRPDTLGMMSTSPGAEVPAPVDNFGVLDSEGTSRSSTPTSSAWKVAAVAAKEPSRPNRRPSTLRAVPAQRALVPVAMLAVYHPALHGGHER